MTIVSATVNSQTRVKGPLDRILNVLLGLTFLAMVDVVLATKRFGGVYRALRMFPVIRRSAPNPSATSQISRDMEIALICYPRRVRCLERSAAVVCLLRSRGILAELVIGVRKVPFGAHAWAEVDGAVVNDKERVRKYIVIDRI